MSPAFVQPSTYAYLADSPAETQLLDSYSHDSFFGFISLLDTAPPVMHLSKDDLRNPWPSIETFPKILTPVWTPKTLDEPQSWMPGLVIFAFKQ